MGPVDVRRLAAIDMHGTAGSRLRRTIITVEFIAGAVIGPALGIWLLLASDSTGWRIFGAYLAAACLNYVPLALHALSMLNTRDLDRELAGVDIPRELWRGTKRQFWLVVPLLFDVIAIPQALGHRPAST